MAIFTELVVDLNVCDIKVKCRRRKPQNISNSQADEARIHAKRSLRKENIKHIRSEAEKIY